MGLSIAPDYGKQLKADGRLVFRYLDIEDTLLYPCLTYADNFSTLLVSVGNGVDTVSRIVTSDIRKLAEKRFSPESFVNAVYENNTVDDSLNIVTLEE